MHNILALNTSVPILDNVKVKFLDFTGEFHEVILNFNSFNSFKFLNAFFADCLRTEVLFPNGEYFVFELREEAIPKEELQKIKGLEFTNLRSCILKPNNSLDRLKAKSSHIFGFERFVIFFIDLFFKYDLMIPLEVSELSARLFSREFLTNRVKTLKHGDFIF